MKTIKIYFDYKCYPIWIYDNQGLLIDNDLPAALKKDGQLNRRIEKLQRKYDALFIDNNIEFSYRGFENAEQKKQFLDEVTAIKQILIQKLSDNYQISAEVNYK